MKVYRSYEEVPYRSRKGPLVQESSFKEGIILVHAGKYKAFIPEKFLPLLRAIHDEGRAVLGAADIAEQLGTTKQWVSRMAIRHDLGKMLKRERVFWPDELSVFRECQRTNKPGRPRITPAE